MLLVRLVVYNPFNYEKLVPEIKHLICFILSRISFNILFIYVSFALDIQLFS